MPDNWVNIQFDVSTAILGSDVELHDGSSERLGPVIKPAAAAEAFEKGICVGKPSLDMSFTPGSCELCTDDTPRDIKRIVFDVEFTVRPKKSS